MKPMTLQEVAAATGGRLQHAQGSARILGVTIDSRAVCAGDLFVALPGERVDGHDFICAALAAGARAALCRRAAAGMPTVRVANPRIALGDMMARYRRKFPRCLVAAVTGSSGKTATKEMLACILSRRQSVLESRGNFNNDLGVPLNLSRLEAHHTRAVLELGMSGPGEIRKLARMIRPGLGIITNIGDAHRGRFRSTRALARAKLELLEELVAPRIAVLNADDPHLVRAASRHRPVWTFGMSPQADVQILGAGVNYSGTVGILQYRGKKQAVRLRALGIHQIWNAAAAVAGGVALGVPFATAVEALHNFHQHAGMRGQLLRLGPHRLIHDAYNSNPQSAAAALELLVGLTTRGKKYFVVGSMLELGKVSESAHRELGRRAALAGVAGLIAVGREAAWTAQSARQAGIKNVRTARSLSAAVQQLQQWLSPQGDLILIKGSRAMGLEAVVTGLKDAWRR